MIGRRRVRRRICASGLLRIALAAPAVACHGWQQRPLSPEAPAVSRDRPVRVLRADQSTIELARPQVVGDSLVGEAGSPPVRTAVALRDVRRLEERRVSARRTSALTLGLGVALLILLLGAAVAAAIPTVG